METKTKRNIAVFCGGNLGNQSFFRAAAEAVAAEFVERGIGLVYGGGSGGLMGAVADAVVAGGGQAFGVIPKVLIAREIAHPRLTELKVVESMHERKKLMYDMADGFLTLPGGFGTMDEAFEIITWKQMKLHDKPFVFLNVEGFYDSLVGFLDRATDAGFIKSEHRSQFGVEKDAKSAVQFLTSHWE
jgi:uncharacterized protein (TIGR00730 family)